MPEGAPVAACLHCVVAERFAEVVQRVGIDFESAGASSERRRQEAGVLLPPRVGLDGEQIRAVKIPLPFPVLVVRGICFLFPGGAAKHEDLLVAMSLDDVEIGRMSSANVASRTIRSLRPKRSIDAPCATLRSSHLIPAVREIVENRLRDRTADLLDHRRNGPRVIIRVLKRSRKSGLRIALSRATPSLATRSFTVDTCLRNHMRASTLRGSRRMK